MMTINVVTLTYDLGPDEDTLVGWSEELDKRDASASVVPGRGVDVTVWVDGFDVFKASVAAAERAHPIVHAEPIAISVVSEAEFERAADAPTLPRLVSAPEVAEMLGGITRQRVHQLRSLASFPAPLVELRTGPIWDASSIERFEREWERKAGRPAMVPMNRPVETA